MNTAIHFEGDCARMRELASARSDGELDDARALDRHLELCGECRAFAAALATSRGELERLIACDAPDGWAAIASRARRRRWRIQAFRAAAALLGCAATLAALRASQSEASSHDASALSPITALAEAPAEQAQLAETPEMQLLAAVTAAEKRR